MKFLPSLLFIFSLVIPSFATTQENIEIREVQQGEIGKIRLMSNNNIPQKVIVVRNGGTAPFVDDLIDTIQTINEESDRMDLKLHVITTSPSAASSFKSKLQAQGLYGDLVEINSRFFTADQWMQDWGEIAVAEVDGQDELQPLILDSNRGRGLAGLPKVFADLWDAYYIKNPARGSKGDYGGNIEVTPDNVLVLGSTSTPKLRKLFDEHGYENKRAILDTSWLIVGHVDEYVSFVPNASADGGYTILKADPALAFNLIKNASEEQLNKTNPEYRSTIKELHAKLNSFGKSIANVREFDLSDETDILKWQFGKGLLSEEESEQKIRLDQLIALNEEITRLIDRNIVILKERIKAVTGTPDRQFSVVSLPTIFRGRKSGDTLSRCVALLPGVVNMLVLANHLVIPDAQMPMLNDYIRDTLNKTSLRSHFLDDMAYHNLAGEIHCGTNVMRNHADYWVYPDHIITMRKFKSLYELRRDLK